MSTENPPKFPVDQTVFFKRIADGDAAKRVVSETVRTHLIALENRVAQAQQSMELGHLGSARAFLELGRRDYDAALAALPKL